MDVAAAVGERPAHAHLHDRQRARVVTRLGLVRRHGSDTMNAQSPRLRDVDEQQGDLSGDEIAVAVVEGLVHRQAVQPVGESTAVERVLQAAPVPYMTPSRAESSLSSVLIGSLPSGRAP